MAKKAKKIDKKAKKFCEEYLLDYNATRAAKAAGYSERSAETLGYRLLRKVEVIEYLAEIKAKTEERLGISRDRVARELAYLAFGDLTQLFDETGRLKELSTLTEAQRALVAQLETEEENIEGVKIGTTRKVKAHNKQAALDALAKMFGYNEPEKVENTVKLDGSKVTFS